MAVNCNFEWDPIKAGDNLDRHGVAFDEAATVFKDPRAISIFDPDHSEIEDRWVAMGISEKGRLLIVSTFFEKEAKMLSRSGLSQAEKQQNMKPHPMVNEHEKRVRFFKRGKRQVLSSGHEAKHSDLSR
jgi:uncharacterized DUF497 family protein